MVRNKYDPITTYMYEWSVPVIELAESKGMTIDHVEGPGVVKSEIISRVKKLNHDFIFLNGHGNSETFCGYEGKAAIEIGDASIFKNKIVFSRACDCAKKLGKISVEKHNCKAFIGYKYDFVNVRLKDTELNPRKDEISRPIWEVSNIVPINLIRGTTVDTAIEASHKRAANMFLRLIFSKELWAREVMKAINTNDEGLDYHGDGSAKIC